MLTTTTAPIEPPVRSAEDLLRRLLDLLRDSHDIADVSRARVRQAFEVDFEVDQRRLGFGERLCREWWSSIELDPDGAFGPSFELAFRPDCAGTFPSASSICAIDFDQFAAELKAMGFEHESLMGENGRVVHENFDRDGLSVIVHTRIEAEEPAVKRNHACVMRVIVN